MVQKAFTGFLLRGGFMLDEKNLKRIENRVKQFLREGVIKTKQPKEHVDFFLNNAKNSLETAQAIYELSTNEEYQNHIGYKGLNGFFVGG